MQREGRGCKETGLGGDKGGAACYGGWLGCKETGKGGRCLRGGWWWRRGDEYGRN